MVVTRSQAAKSGELQTNITDSFQIRESSKISTTVVATGRDGKDVAVSNTVKSEVAVTFTSPVSKKRKTDNDDAEASSSPKKRNVSTESNPALSTRSQVKAFQEAGTDVAPKSIRASKPKAQASAAKKSAHQKAHRDSQTKEEEGKMVAVGPIHKYTKLTLVIRLKVNQELLAANYPTIHASYLSLQPLIKDQLIQRRFLFKKAKTYWDNATYRVKFGESLHTEFASPTYEQAREVFDILSKDLREKHNITVNADGSTNTQIGPVHGTQNPTVDIFVRTIMAQGTGNVLALAAQEEMRDYFRYDVDGKMVKGVLPNYHAMLGASDETLAGVIKHAGLGNKRAKYIKAALQTVYDKNVADLKAANNGQIPTGTELGQQAGTAEFVPGMLSIDSLCSMSKKDALNYLLSISGIGVKTAICIMEFNLGFALCAVDTHIMKMATWLKHLPPNMTSEIAAFNHLDGRYPEDLKHALHQVFWHHAQVCKRCKRKALADDSRPEDRPCPIEHLLQRVGGRGSRTNRKSKQVSSTRKPAEPRVKQEKRYRDLKDFKSDDDAAAAGYELWEYSIDDDFAAGSVNVSVRQCYRKIKVEEIDMTMKEAEEDEEDVEENTEDFDDDDDDDVDVEDVETEEGTRES